MVTIAINHWCPRSGVWFCPQDSSDHSLTLPYLKQASASILHWEGTYWTWGHYCQILRKKMSSSCNSGGFLNNVPRSMSIKRAKPVSGLFFPEEREKMMLTLESPLFLFITGVRAPVIFIGHTADILISAVYFWLWCQPHAIFRTKEGWDVWRRYVQYSLYFSNTSHSVLRDHLDGRD